MHTHITQRHPGRVESERRLVLFSAPGTGPVLDSGEDDEPADTSPGLDPVDGEEAAQAARMDSHVESLTREFQRDPDGELSPEQHIKNYEKLAMEAVATTKGTWLQTLQAPIMGSADKQAIKELIEKTAEIKVRKQQELEGGMSSVIQKLRKLAMASSINVQLMEENIEVCKKLLASLQEKIADKQARLNNIRTLRGESKDSIQAAVTDLGNRKSIVENLKEEYENQLDESPEGQARLEAKETTEYLTVLFAEQGSEAEVNTLMAEYVMGNKSRLVSEIQNVARRMFPDDKKAQEYQVRLMLDRVASMTKSSLLDWQGWRQMDWRKFAASLPDMVLRKETLAGAVGIGTVLAGQFWIPAAIGAVLGARTLWKKGMTGSWTEGETRRKAVAGILVKQKDDALAQARQAAEVPALKDRLKAISDLPIGAIIRINDGGTMRPCKITKKSARLVTCVAMNPAHPLKFGIDLVGSDGNYVVLAQALPSGGATDTFAELGTNGAHINI